MRLLVQRVNSASVSYKNRIVGKIDKGYLVLVGVKKGDTEEDCRRLAGKLAKLRVMADREGKMNKSLSEANAGVLAVSQFTLYADSKKGNRPSFVKAAEPALAKKLYQRFIEIISQMGIHVEKGIFGGYMNIKVDLDGPVTIIL